MGMAGRWIGILSKDHDPCFFGRATGIEAAKTLIALGGRIIARVIGASASAIAGKSLAKERQVSPGGSVRGCAYARCLCGKV